LKEEKRIRLAIFASGGGSNARKIVGHFRDHPHVSPVLFLTHNPQSGVLNLGKEIDCPVLVLGKSQLRDGGYLLAQMDLHHIDLIVLAGYIKYIPVELVRAFPGKILNIHPSLLPQFGGKGMYGIHVHRAVLEAGETKSGMTIHLVNEEYDKGEIICQAEVHLDPSWTAEEVAAAVLKLEHEHYAPTIERLCERLFPE